jgi:hypothetical protein
VTEIEARAYVELFAQTAKHPTLDANEIALCLAPYVQEDGTYTVTGAHRAMCDAWDVKYAKAVDHHDVSVNGRGISAAQVTAHCKEMGLWARRRLPVEVA